MLTIDVTDRRDRLALLEGQIERELENLSQGQLRLWTALATIRDEQLWKLEYPSFKVYVKTRWGWEETNGHEVANAGQIAKQLIDSGVPESTLAESVAAYRPLKPLEPEQRREVWVDAVREAGGDRPTANQVREAVERVQRRDNTLTPGSVALVVAGEHQGKQVIVQKVENGAIAHSTLPNSAAYPFMVGELRVIEAAPAPEPPPKKPTLKDELEGLKSLLRQVYETAVEGSSLSDDLVVAIERALA